MARKTEKHAKKKHCRIWNMARKHKNEEKEKLTCKEPRIWPETMENV
jgi:hypothetical protein